MISSTTASGLAASFYTGAQPAGPTPATLAPDAFARWPVAAQISFVKAHGQGDPRTVLIGPEDGPRSIATLNAAGTDVAVAEAPFDIDTASSALDFETFRTWSNTAQVYYVQTRGQSAGPGQPLSVGLGRVDADNPQAVATLVSVSGRATGVTLTASAAYVAATQATVAKAPDKLDAASFFALLPQQQYDYVASKGTGTPKTVTLAGAGADALTVTLEQGGTRYAVKVPAAAYSQLSQSASGTPPVSGVRESAFTTWPDAVQRAYVEAQAGGTTYPKLILLQGGTQFAMIAAAGADVERVPVPTAWKDATSALPPATFLNWPPAAQLAFLIKQGSPLTLQSPYGSGQTLTIAGATSTDGLTLTSPAQPNTAPASLDPALFPLWPAADQAAYLKAHLGAADIGALASLPVGANSVLLTLADDGSVRADAIPGAAYPAGFTTPPAALAPATFMAWPAAVRAHYVRQNTLTQDATQGLALTIGPATEPQLSATVSPTGTLWLSGTRPLGLETTTGMGLPNPTANIYGSAGGLGTAPNAQSAEVLFPTLDGSPGKTITDKPAAIAKQFAKLPADLSADEFGQWNTAIQLEYLRTHGDSTLGYRVEFGTAATGTVKPTAFISEAGNKVYTVAALQKTDIGKMSAKDQEILVKLPAFTIAKTGRAADLDLTIDRTGLVATLDALAADIQKDLTPLKGGASGMTFDDRQVFLDQIAILKGKLASTSIASTSTVQTQIDELKTRFERANAFATAVPGKALLADLSRMTYGNGSSSGLLFPAGTTRVKVTVTNGTQVSEETISLADFMSKYVGRVDPSADVTTGQFKTKTFSPAISVAALDDNNARIQYQRGNEKVDYDVMSISSLTAPIGNRSVPTLSADGNIGLVQSYNQLMQQERQILSLARSRETLARTGTLAGGAQHLDVPNLVYLFQLQANLTGEAKLRADTEELNQINALVKLYGVAQNYINSVLKGGDSSKKDAIGGARSAEENAAAAFFSSQAKHPIEIIYSNISHPIDNLASRSYDSWTKSGTQFSERVTLINQESQIKMNAVNSSTKAKDRNFDLANNALTKMNEIVQKIAGAM